MKKSINVRAYIHCQVRPVENRLYNDSPYLKEWQTEVTDVLQRDGKYHITLAETAFYPEVGGQTADRGTIEGIPVEDVLEQNDTIYHVLSALPQNKIVACALDFGRRFDHMQQHTGQHLLSAVFELLYKADTSSFHMGEEDVSIEIALPEVTGQIIRAVEDRTNELIYRDLPVTTHVVSPEEASRFPGVHPPANASIIRVVEIDSVEFNACCGTHVSRLGEIGIIKVIRTEKMGTAQTRVYFKCGSRALKDYQAKNEITAAMSRQYKVTEAELLSRVEAQAGQLKAAKIEVEELKEKLLDIEAVRIAKSATAQVIQISFEDRHFDELNFLGKRILQNGEFILILSSVPDKRLVLACGKGFDLNCGKIFKEQLASFNGKGGGSPGWANAGFTNPDDMRRFEEFLKGLNSGYIRATP